MRVAVIMTCFNRVAKTLKCLEGLSAAAGKCNWMQFDIWLNDDKSTDGTVEAVERSKVVCNNVTLTIVLGSGKDYWCGGMRRAWAAAIDSGVKYAGYLWLNDDTFVRDDLVSIMHMGDRDYDNCIVVGAIKDVSTNRMTYGGFGPDGVLVPVNGEMQKVELINGNCVFVPQKVFAKLGNFPGYLTHCLGDTDYAVRAGEEAISIYQTATYVGVCDDRRCMAALNDPKRSLWVRMKSLYSPIPGPEPKVLFRYNCNHYGVIRAIKVWTHQHVRVVFPAVMNWYRSLQVSM